MAYNTRKLGSLLGIEEDVNKRIQLSFASFQKLEILRKHRALVAEHIRIKSYRALVESILIYNCGTWALSSSLADKLARSSSKKDVAPSRRRVLASRCVMA
jgi:hypothetical protein